MFARLRFGAAVRPLLFDATPTHCPAALWLLLVLACALQTTAR